MLDEPSLRDVSHVQDEPKASKLTKKCASLATTVTVASTFHLAAVRLSNGSNITTINAFDTTFAVTCISYPSAMRVASRLNNAAFANTTSNLSNSPSARRQNARTLSNEHRSSGQTSITESLDSFSDSSMSALAASPRSVLRQARMTRAARRRTKWRAASRPRPLFAPVTMTVRPA